MEDYQQLLQLSTRLCRADILSKCTASTEQPSTMLDAALHEQTLRFLTAVLAGHGQKVRQAQSLGPDPHQIIFSFTCMKSCQTGILEVHAAFLKTHNHGLAEGTASESEYPTFRLLMW